MTIHDAVSPAFLTFMRVFGYGVLFVSIVVVLSAGARAYAEGQAAYKRSQWY
jgi:hypothetical protein